MDNTQVTGTVMAKVSKSLMMNRDLSMILDEVQKRTGASFTRIVTAAILKFFFETLEESDPFWMTVSVLLEKGSITISEVPTTWIRLWEEEFERRAKEFEVNGETAAAKHVRDAAIPIIHGKGEIWDTRIAEGGGDVEGVINAINRWGFPRGATLPIDSDATTNR